MAGRFKGDVRIDGNFNIDRGAHLTGQVLAGIVVVGGELQGNIESAKRVDVLEGGVIVGDVKAGLDHGCGRLAHARARRVRLGRREGQNPRAWPASSAVMSVVRQGTLGATRVCPHCKATVLAKRERSARAANIICDSTRRTPSRRPQAISAMRSRDRSIIPRAASMRVLRGGSITNEQGEKIARHVVGVGALQTRRAAQVQLLGRSGAGARAAQVPPREKSAAPRACGSLAGAFDVDEAQELGARAGIGTESADMLAGHHRHPALVHAARRHALMDRVDDDADSAGLEHFVDATRRSAR